MDLATELINRPRLGEYGWVSGSRRSSKLIYFVDPATGEKMPIGYMIHDPSMSGKELEKAVSIAVAQWAKRHMETAQILAAKAVAADAASNVIAYMLACEERNVGDYPYKPMADAKGEGNIGSLVEDALEKALVWDEDLFRRCMRFQNSFRDTWKADEGILEIFSAFPRDLLAAAQNSADLIRTAAENLRCEMRDRSNMLATDMDKLFPVSSADQSQLKM